MNDTNRALNRTLIIAVGLLLLVLGTAVAVAAAVPSFLASWVTASATAGDAIADAVASTPLAPGGHSWLLVAGGALALVVAALLVVFVVRQGRGHTRLLAERDRKSTRLNSSHLSQSRMPSSA